MARPRKNDLPVRMQEKAGTYYHTPKVDGKTKWVNLGKDRKIAMQKWARLEGGGRSIADALSEYCESSSFLSLADSTRGDYERYIDMWIEKFGWYAMDDITTAMLCEFVYERGYKGNRELAPLSGAYKVGLRKRWCASNPCIGVIRAKEPKRVRAILTEDVEAMRAFLPQWMKTVVDVAVTTALRQGDIINLDQSCVKKQGLLVHVSKTSRPILFKWTPFLKSISYPLVNSKGDRLNEYAIRSAWRRAKNKANVKDLQFKDLRRFALQCRREVDNIHSAMELADHTDINTTRIYLAGTAASVEPLSVPYRTD